MGLILLDSSPTPIQNGRYHKVTSTLTHAEGSSGVLYTMVITVDTNVSGSTTSASTFTYTTTTSDTSTSILSSLRSQITTAYSTSPYKVEASISGNIMTTEQTTNTANPYGFTVTSTVDSSSVVLFPDSDYLIALSRDTGIIDFHSTSADAWSDITLDLRSDTDTGTYFPVFFSADGEVRVSDAILNENTRPKGLYYLDYMSAGAVIDTTPGGVSDTPGWAVDVAYCDNSTLECMAVDKGGSDPTSSFDANNYLGFAAGNGGVTVNWWETADGNSTWGEDSYGLYYALVYGKSVSLPRRVKTASAGTDNHSIKMTDSGKVPNFEFTWASGITGASYRITGYQFFLNYKGQLYFFAEIDKKLGIRLAEQTKYTTWDVTDAGYQHESVGPLVNPTLVETFDSMNGYSWRLSANGFDTDGTGFKTACIANRRAWVGNVRLKDRQGVVQTLPDAVIKSPINQFDVFPYDNIIEPVVNDGSEVTALYEFADRLMMFKNIDLYIINIGGQIEYLEQKVPFAGVHRPQQVCETPYGVCWINPRGIYLYSGKGINKLNEKQGRKLLSDDQLQTFTGTYSAVGYDYKLNKLFLKPDYLIPSEALIYDFVSQSWARQEDAYTVVGTRGTNFSHDNEGRIIWGRSLTTSGTTTATQINMMGEDPISGWSNLESGFIDFGDPATFKQLMSVYVTYTTGEEDEPANYTTNMNSAVLNSQIRFYLVNEKGVSCELKARNSKETLIDNITDDGHNRAVLKYTSTMQTAGMKLQSSGLKNFRSIKYILTGYFPLGFVLEDITLTFKPKKPK